MAHDNLQQLVQWGTETHGLTDMAPLLEKVLQMTVSLVGAERGFYVVRKADGLTFKASTVDPRERNPRSWQFAESIVEEAFRTGELQHLIDASGMIEAVSMGIRSVLAIPLHGRDGVIAVVYTDWRMDVDRPRPETRGLVETFASQAAQAIINCQISLDSASQARQLEMLNNLAKTVSTTLVLTSVLDLVAEFTLKLTGSDRVFVLLSENGEHLRCHLARDRGGLVLTDSGEKVSSSITQRVLSTLEAECVLDTRGHAQFQAQQSILDLNLRSVMCVPLTVNQEALGVLYVDSQVVVNAFTDKDLDLLKAIASQASVAIQNAKLYERATVDGLTRLFVRSYFEQKLGVEVRRAVRYGSEMSVLMMDIDHFKKFNDTYGHSTGDDVLRLVADVIRANIREELDVAARFGGEEMLVLMPETDLEGAMIVAERLRVAIATTPLPGPDGSILSVNVSIGVAAVPDHATTPVELVELADQALYHSKRNGRNRVSSATLIVTPEPTPS
jgi:diguanylate cyclase (GGDEF)-like protein